MGFVDIAVFVAFIAAVVFVALLKSREADGEKDTQDFFLAGRGLTWWLVGFSLIAANISTEQFVGMSGAAASHVGLAIASYEWLAAVTLVVVAFFFLPYFLRAGIYTIPEFLEYRFNRWARLLMSAATVFIYILLMGAVTYSGALTVQTLGAEQDVSIQLWQPSLAIALLAMVYVVAGGLKASVWADLLQGSALIVGGAIVMYLAFGQLGEAETAATIADASTGAIEIKTLDPEQGAVERFMELNSNRMNMFLPKEDKVLPWTALLLGVWIPNFYYWGLNQYITQRTLGSSSLAEGQKGIVFASYLKLIIPFVVVIPGIIAFNLFHEEMRDAAAGDRAAAIAKYARANPDTQHVAVVENVSDEQLAAHEGPSYLLAVYDGAEAPSLEEVGPYALAMTRAEYDDASPAAYQLFSATEDRAWRGLNPNLAEEIDAHNERTVAAAEEAGADTAKQALVSYKYDTALGHLLGMLPSNGLRGFVIAALLGAVISSLAAMLNAASSLFTLDIYNELPGESTQARVVSVGRVAVVVFAFFASVLAPALGDPNISNSVFTIIQKGQGLLSPGVLAAFAFGLLVRRAPRSSGVVALLVNAAVYGGLWWASAYTNWIDPDSLFFGNFLNWMAISFVLCIGVMAAMTALAPLAEPVTFEAKTDLDLNESKGARVAGIICVILTLVLYAVFSPLGVAG